MSLLVALAQHGDADAFLAQRVLESLVGGELRLHLLEGGVDARRDFLGCPP